MPHTDEKRNLKIIWPLCSPGDDAHLSLLRKKQAHCYTHTSLSFTYLSVICWCRLCRRRYVCIIAVMVMFMFIDSYPLRFKSGCVRNTQTTEHRPVPAWPYKRTQEGFWVILASCHSNYGVRMSQTDILAQQKLGVYLAQCKTYTEHYARKGQR
jgi:hypothetical protein